MARSKKQATTAAKAGKSLPAVVNLSGRGSPAGQETTRYAGPEHKPARTAAHRKPVMVDPAASNRDVTLTEACVMDGRGRHRDKRQVMRSAAESGRLDGATHNTLSWLTGGWPRFALAKHKQDGK